MSPDCGQLDGCHQGNLSTQQVTSFLRPQELYQLGLGLSLDQTRTGRRGKSGSLLEVPVVHNEEDEVSVEDDLRIISTCLLFLKLMYYGPNHGMQPN